MVLWPSFVALSTFRTMSSGVETTSSFVCNTTSPLVMPRPAASLFASTCVTTTPLSLFSMLYLSMRSWLSGASVRPENVSLGSNLLRGRRSVRRHLFIAANWQRSTDRREEPSAVEIVGERWDHQGGGSG